MILTTVVEVGVSFKVDLLSVNQGALEEHRYMCLGKNSTNR